MHAILNILIIGIIFAISVPGVFISKNKVNGKPTNGNIIMGAIMFMVLTYLYLNFTGQGAGSFNMASLGLSGGGGGGANPVPLIGQEGV